MTTNTATPCRFYSMQQFIDFFIPLVEVEELAERTDTAKRPLVARAIGRVVVDPLTEAITIKCEFAYVRKLEEGTTLRLKVVDVVGRRSEWDDREEAALFPVVVVEVVALSRTMSDIACTLKVLSRRAWTPTVLRNFTSGVIFALFSLPNRVSKQTFDNMFRRLRDEVVMSRTLCSLLLRGPTSPEENRVTLSERRLAEVNRETLPLNASQRNAVLSCLRHRVTLIHGPPGTGKTHTSASIVRAWSQEHGYKIMVCAASNAAVANLAQSILKVYPRKEEVLIIESVMRQGKGPEALRPFTLYERTNRLVTPQSASMRQWHAEWPKGIMTPKDFRRYMEHRKALERQLVSNARVVCCTTAMSTRPLIVDSGSLFQCVLTDEACQCTEPSSWLPLINGARRLVLVGDHKQLEPFVRSLDAQQRGLRRSLFGRLLEMCAFPVTMLNTQYRMHPTLCRFPSRAFYGGQLQSGVTVQDRGSPIFHPPDEHPMTFFDVPSKTEARHAESQSYANPTEAETVVSLLEQLCVDCKIPLKEVSVLTPYTGQIDHITRRIIFNPKLGPDAAEQVEVCTVDEYQGRENEYIIFCCVRSNAQNNIGFLADERRLNVALTRARRGLIMVGDVTTLSESSSLVWRSLIQHFDDHSAIFHLES